MNNRPYWIIRRSEKGDVIARTNETEPTDVPTSKEVLQQTLSLLAPDVYIIQTWEGADPQKTTGTKYAVHFRLQERESMVNMNAIAGMQQGDIESKIAEGVSKAIKDYEEKQTYLRKIEALEKQLKEGSSSGIDAATERILNKFEPWFPNFFGEPKGNIGKTTEPMTKELEDISVESIEILQQALGAEKFAKLMQKLAIISKEKPLTFKAAVNQVDEL